MAQKPHGLIRKPDHSDPIPTSSPLLADSVNGELAGGADVRAEVASVTASNPAPTARVSHSFSKVSWTPPPAPLPEEHEPAKETAIEDVGAATEVPKAPAANAGSAVLIQRAPDPSAPPPGQPDGAPPAVPTDTKSGGGGSTNFVLKPSTREISASNLTALWDALTRSGTREAASVQPSLKPDPQYDYDDQDKVKKVVINVVETKEMPAWKEADAQCPPIKAEWLRYYGVLDAHENKHVAIDRKYYENVHLKLIGKKREDAWQTLDGVVAAADTDNQTYDTQTDHGVNEGAHIKAAVQCAPEKIPNSTSDGSAPAPTTPAPMTPEASETSPQAVVMAEPPAIGEAHGGGEVVQAKRAVSQPGDPFEVEADQVADAVLRSDDDRTKSTVQRTCAAPGTCNCERCRARREREQAPDSVGAVIDGSSGQPLEPTVRSKMEARLGYDFGSVRVHSDGAAARSAASLEAQAYTVGPNVVFGAGRYAPETNDGQRLIAHELTHVVQQGAHGGQSPVQRAAVPGSRTALPNEQPGVLTGSGQPLAPEIRKPAEARFGHDFGAVRVHTDGPAAETAATLGATAFTVGRNIGFAPGRFAPDTPSGHALLHHELVHVVQGDRAPAPNRLVSGVDDAAEREAAAVGDSIASGPIRPTMTPSAIIHRDPLPPAPKPPPAGGSGTKPPPVTPPPVKFDENDPVMLQLRAKILDGIKKSTMAENKYVGDVFGLRVELTGEELEPARDKVRKALQGKFPDIKRRSDRALADYQAEYSYRANMPFWDRSLWDLAHTNFFGGPNAASPNPLDRDPGDQVRNQVENVDGHLAKVDKFLKENDYTRAVQYLESAERGSYDAIKPLVRWKEQDLKGAENTIGQLEAIKFASDVALVALGGLGGISMAKTAGTISMGQAIATQGVLIAAKYAAGDHIDWKKEGVTGLINVLLAKFSGVMSNRLAKGLAGPGAATLAEDMSNKIIAALIVHEGSTLLQTSVEFVYRNNFEAGKKPATWQEFFDALMIRMTDPKGLVLAALGAAMQSATDFKPGSAPKPAGTDTTSNDPVFKQTGTVLSSGGPDGVAKARAVITEEKNFYGVRIHASDRGGWGPTAQPALEGARQQMINEVVADVQAKHPNTVIEKSGGGFINPYVIKVRPKGSPPTGSGGTTAPAVSPAATTGQPPGSPMATTGQEPPTPAGGIGTQTAPAGGGTGGGSTTAPAQNPQVLAWRQESIEAWSALGARLNGVPFRPWAPVEFIKSLDAKAVLDIMPDMESGKPLGSGEYQGMAPKLDEARWELVRNMGGKQASNASGTEGTSEKMLLKDKETGEEYLFKPQAGDPKNLVHELHGIMPGSFMNRARAAHGVGLQMPSAMAGSPAVGIVEYKGQYGSLQKWVKGTRSLNQLHEEDPKLAAEVVRSPEFQKFKSALDVYDFVINSVDRNPGNVLVKFGPDGKTVEGFLGIDHDLSLTPGMRIVGGGIKAVAPPAKISRATYNELLGMKANEAAIRDGLTLTLNPQLQTDRSAKIDGIFERLDTLLKGYDAQQKAHGADSIFLDGAPPTSQK